MVRVFAVVRVPAAETLPGFLRGDATDGREMVSGRQQRGGVAVDQ